jgi:hypothetical protein
MIFLEVKKVINTIANKLLQRIWAIGLKGKLVLYLG